MRRLVAVAGILAFLMTSAPAEARPGYYGDQARTVARSIDCHHFSPDPEAGTFSRGKCTARGKRLTVVIFRNATQQARWNARVEAVLQTYYPPGRYHYAEAAGAIVGHKSFGRPAARLAARRLDGGRVRTVRVR